MQDSNQSSLFQPLNKQEELFLLQSDSSDWQATKRYLDKLICQSLDKFVFDKEVFEQLHLALLDDVPIAASRFLQNGGAEKDYSFATYFTWYVSERINAVANLKRK